MGLFNRHKADPDVPDLADPNVAHRSRNHSLPQIYSMSARPTFGQWLKLTWLDILTMAVMGALGLGV